MNSQARRSAWPDLPDFAGHVATLKGLRRLVDLGGEWPAPLRLAYPGLRVETSERGDTRAAYVIAGDAAALCGPDGTIARLGERLRKSPLIIVATEAEPSVRAALEEQGLHPEFAGRTRRDAADASHSGWLFVMDPALSATHPPSDRATPPDDFHVVALLTVHNEADILRSTLEKLHAGGVDFYVIDNWSTDESPEIARSFEGRGLVGFERFPARPSEHFSLRPLLGRVADVAHELPASWCIHHDVDEVRLGPWPGVGLREALWRVDRAGYNAVDFTVVNFRPTDDGFVPGEDFERHLRHFEFGSSPDLLLQIKTWKNVRRVDLQRFGGHQALFPRRHVFPYKFLLKHYPIRSQTHGERKVLGERVNRWDPAERALGWHTQYDDAATRPSFLASPDDLLEDMTDIRTAYLPEALAGAGLSEPQIPGWALRGGRFAFVYVHSRWLARTRGYQALRNRIRAGRTAG